MEGGVIQNGGGGGGGFEVGGGGDPPRTNGTSRKRKAMGSVWSGPSSKMRPTTKFVHRLFGGTYCD